MNQMNSPQIGNKQIGSAYKLTLGQQQQQPFKQQCNYSTEIYSFYYKGLYQSNQQVELYTQFPEIKEFNDILNLSPILNRIYLLAIENLQCQSYKNALFFAEKLSTLVNRHPLVIYLMGECFFFNHDYKKVHSLFVKQKLLTYNQNFQILAARALLKNKQFEQCLSILELPIESTVALSNKLEAQKLLIKAQCQEANENKEFTIFCFHECLKKDPTCIEAFTRLIDCYLLTTSEKENLLTQLNFQSDDIWIKKFYLSLIKTDYLDEKKVQQKLMFETHLSGGDVASQLQPRNFQNQIYQGILSGIDEEQQRQIQPYKYSEQFLNDWRQVKPDNVFEILNQKDNIDILCIKAKNASSKYNIAKAYEIAVKTIKEDPLFFEIIPIYCTCLLELNYLGELYYCAHNLIENYQSHPLSWFAIGCYYFLIQKYEIARKYFQKAHTIDRNFIYTWIGFGHAFAIQDESDQAMSVYRTCSRLFPGCFSAHLYMGMEYLRTNNLKTAMLSFQWAKDINQSDPLIYNEIGVIFFKQKQYKEAKDMFLHAINLCDEAISWVCESILSNLGHTYRKLKEFKDAIKVYEKCVSLNSKNPDTFFSLAFTYHISNQLNKAICYYHKSIRYKYDNQFANEMLAKALTDSADLPWDKIYNI